MLSHGKSHDHDRHENTNSIIWNRRAGIAFYKELNDHSDDKSSGHRARKCALRIAIDNNFGNFTDRHIAPGSCLQILKCCHGSRRKKSNRQDLIRPIQDDAAWDLIKADERQVANEAAAKRPIKDVEMNREVSQERSCNSAIEQK